MATNELDMSSWIGRTGIREDLIAPGPATRLPVVVYNANVELPNHEAR